MTSGHSLCLSHTNIRIDKNRVHTSKLQLYFQCVVVTILPFSLSWHCTLHIELYVGSGNPGGGARDVRRRCPPPLPSQQYSYMYVFILAS